ncbi:MAG: 2-oxoglutarate dehydrogenase complex dihydrolipoyllysine-residue succinyltransferase [Ferrovum sp.]|nr:2-oxoglutarate dehydrogenase complex dihydrolipoyllysine-residue succinyltransferase [Ferrovum sp.]NDU87502.1 2-oxoglutarate dehydrogenase complex dihydrolipoyllysine-residue succinyltransferase [Ferrovum sp.]
MTMEIKVPPLAESVTEASLVTWHVAEGEQVVRDQNLADIETDKVVLELPAPRSGILRQMIKKAGDRVVAGEVVGLLEENTEAVPSAPATPPAREAAPATEVPFALPAARKIMAEKGMDPQTVVATGKGGRILKEDVVRSMAPVATPAPTGVDASARPATRVPLSPLRQRVAERLMASQSNTATLTTFNEVDMSAVLALRQRHKEAFEKTHGIKLGLMSFFVKAVVSALHKFPLVNSRIEGTEVVTPGYIDLGVAVGSKRGLLVPVLRNAQNLSMADIERQIADFSQRAGEGHIRLDELEGGTFSITNGGVFGSMLSTPILNPPQSAILGIHATKERAVVVDGQIVVRPMNYLALSYDHRLIDGREAVLTLVAIKEGLEDPGKWLLDL